jgi:hypothetical protein
VGDYGGGGESGQRGFGFRQDLHVAAFGGLVGYEGFVGAGIQGVT